MAVRVVSVVDVACARKQDVASAQLALEVDNELLLQVEREGKSPIDEMNRVLSVIQLNRESERLQVSLEKISSKLQNRLLKSKGGSGRKQIKEGKTRVTLQEGDMLDVGVLERTLQQAEVSNNIQCSDS